MSTPTVTRPTLREVILDALEDAYWLHHGEIEGCRDCTRNPAGICAEHQADNEAAHEYDEARKQIQQCSDALLVPVETERSERDAA